MKKIIFWLIVILTIIISGLLIIQIGKIDKKMIEDYTSNRIIDIVESSDTTTTKKTTTTTKKTTKRTTQKRTQSITNNDNNSFRLTHYGWDCKGCGGNTAIGYNVKNTIYYNDKDYGTIRILAADKSIPCGSIIHIKNYKFVEGNEFTGIVLDRGSAIVGLTMDLLYPSEADTVVIGRQRNIEFSIERWGWK